MVAKYKQPLAPAQLAIVDQRIQRIYDELNRWVGSVTRSEQIRGNWIMDGEELYGEAWVVVCKVARVYIAKEWDEFVILVKASIQNMIGAMRYKACLTHRKVELTVLELDRDSVDSESGDADTLGDALSIDNVLNTFGESSYAMATNPAHYVEMAERFLELSNQLSKLDYQVLDVLLGNNPMAEHHIRLAAARKTFAYKNPTITITPLIIARTLNQPIGVIEESFQRLRGIYGNL